MHTAAVDNHLEQPCSKMTNPHVRVQLSMVSAHCANPGFPCFTYCGYLRSTTRPCFGFPEHSPLIWLTDLKFVPAGQRSLPHLQVSQPALLS